MTDFPRNTNIAMSAIFAYVFGLLLTSLLDLQKGLCCVLKAPCNFHDYRQKGVISSWRGNCLGASLPC